MAEKYLIVGYVGFSVCNAEKVSISSLFVCPGPNTDLIPLVNGGLSSSALSAPICFGMHPPSQTVVCVFKPARSPGDVTR